MSKNNLLNAIRLISREKGIEEDKVIDILKMSFVTVCRRNFGLAQNINVNIDSDNGSVQVVAYKRIKEDGDVDDERLEISLSEAKKININYNIGDIAEVIITPKDFGRVAAQTAKQIVSQKFLELEYDALYNKFIDKKDKIIIGIVRCADPDNFMVDLDGTEIIFPRREQVPGEIFQVGDRIKLYVENIRRHPKGVRILISRTHPNFIRCLFEREIPEVSSGVIKIMDIVRDPGKRCKVAVFSHDSEIEAIGSCVGENGNRINNILAEIRDEKIDLINWHENTEEYIASALSPAKINQVKLNSDESQALVIVDKDQVSLAIGKSGQNVKLAAKLVGIRLDVKTLEQLGYATEHDENDIDNTKCDSGDNHYDTENNIINSDKEDIFDQDIDNVDDYGDDYQDQKDPETQNQIKNDLSDNQNDIIYNDDYDYEDDYEGDYQDQEDPETQNQIKNDFSDNQSDIIYNDDYDYEDDYEDD